MFANDIGIDLGTANTLIYVKGKGIELEEATVAAADMETKKILAIGENAKELIGKTPEKIYALKPVRKGVIADFDLAETMLEVFMKYVKGRRVFGKKPGAVLCVPAGITEVEKKAAIEAIAFAGAKPKGIFLIESTMAAAIGAGLSVTESSGVMVAEIGAGISQAAVISLGTIVNKGVSFAGGEAFDESIIKYIREKYNLSIGIGSAEKIKKEIGALWAEGEDSEKRQIRGIDINTGLPGEILVDCKELSKPIKDTAEKIADMIREVFSSAPYELKEDIKENGLILTGGGALLKGIDEFMRNSLGMNVYVAEDPLRSVILGCGKVLENMDMMKTVLETS